MAATTSNERIQEISQANNAKCNQVKVLLAALKVKDKQVNTLISKLTKGNSGIGGRGDINLHKIFSKN